MEDNKTTNAYFAIVNRIASILKLDDAGKIQKFFTREIKQLDRQIAAIDANKKATKIQYDMDVIKQSDVIEDTQAAVENAYDGVDVDRIKNNADSNAFSIDYWKAIDNAEKALTREEEILDELKEAYDEKIKSYNKQIKRRKDRISKIK